MSINSTVTLESRTVRVGAIDSLLIGEQIRMRRSYAFGVTTSEAQTLLSVRGQAQRSVDPDQVDIHAAVSQTRDTKEAASAEVVALVANVVDDLAKLDGVVLTAQSSRAPLTWSAQSLRTAEDFEKSSGSYGPTGRHTSSVNLVIAVREFTLLGRVEEVLTTLDAVAVHAIQWSVDDDNPEWGQVRADAIRAALLKGQDYASALGGSVTGVEHVADAGLLGGSDHGQSRRNFAGAVAMSGGGPPESASLDPVPQVLGATIEARLTATVGPLPSR